MFRLVSADAYKLPPGQHRHFGSADNPAFLKEVLKSSWIPKQRKDKVPKKEEPKAASPSTDDVQKPKDVVITVIPEVEAAPEPQHVPPALMSRKAMGKAMKAGRKTVQGKTARAMMHSNATTPVKRRSSPKKERVPKPEQPPFVLDDAALREAARKALNGFSQRQRKVFHAIDVMAVMRDPYAKEPEYSRILIAYIVGVLVQEVSEAQRNGTTIDRRFLHAKSSRAFGQLIKQAWERLQGAASYNDSEIRGWWVRRFDGEGMEIFFLVDSKDRPHMIHAAMGKDRFRQWTRGWSCCELSSAEKPKKRSRP